MRLQITLPSFEEPAPATAPPPSNRLTAAGVAAAAALVALATQPKILADAAAVELRYAERFASGAGLTFNHGESLLGFAHPLWTFLLAALGMGIGNVELSAQLLGIAAFAFTAALLVRIGSAIGDSELVGLLAATLAIILPSFRDAMLAGSGSALTVCLALAALDQSLRTRPLPAGILFGLAALDSPSALALPAGLGIASWMQERKLPRRLLDFTVSTWLLLLAVLLLAFGGIFPLHREISATPFPAPLSFAVSPATWLCGRFGYCLLFLAAARLLYLDRRLGRERIGVLALAIAFALELLARLLVQGREAPSFELVTLLPPLLLLACGTPRAIARSHEPYRKARVMAAAVLLTLVALPGLGSTIGRAAGRGTATAREAFDLELRDAGRWLNAAAHKDELVETPSAWAAFELANDVAGVVPRPAGNAAESPAYQVVWGRVAEGQASRPLVPADMVPLAIFDRASREHRELPWIAVLGTAKSQAGRSGVRAFTLLDFDPPAPLAPPYGLQHVQFEGRDLFAHPPSGARFRIPNLKRAIEIRFTPAFSPKVPPQGSDGVTFEIAEEGKVRYSSHLLPTDPVEPVRLRLVAARERDETELVFVTTPGPTQNAIYDWAYWRDVRIELEASPEPARELQAPDS